MRSFLWSVWFLAVGMAVVAWAAPQSFDVLILNGRVLDGTGNPAIRADVGIAGDQIVAIGDLSSATGAHLIDATGLYVVPGFIDMHSHADRGLAGNSVEKRQAHNLVAQGVTTVVVGPDGRNERWPISAEIEAYRWKGIALNVVPMVGHGTVRQKVMGNDYERAATDVEIEQMRRLVRQGMDDGAWGMGAGPEYRPGRFSTTEELIALAEVVAEYDGFYYAHQRSQAPLPLWQTPSDLYGWRLTGTEGMAETIRVGRETGIRVVGSHIKAKGPSSWGHSSIDVLMIERARADGVEVYLDQYPYETFGGGPTAVIPRWAYAPLGTDRSGGLDDPDWGDPALYTNHKKNLRAHLADPVVGAELVGDIEYLLDMQGGADRHIIVLAPPDDTLVGLTLDEVAAEQGRTPVEQLIEFALDGTPEILSGVLFRPVAGHQFDVDNYMSQDYTATSTDASIQLDRHAGQHPRYYGSYARKIAHYARDRGLISLSFAVRSSTGLPAEIIGHKDRGILREGAAADLVIFNYETLSDRTTILEPHHYPSGMRYVMVNGQLTLDAGQLTGALPGRVLVR